MTTAERTTCPLCRKGVTLRKDGTLRHHTNGTPEFPGAPFTKRCPASGTRPDTTPKEN